MKKLIFVQVLIFLFVSSAIAQQIDDTLAAGRQSALNIFLDCPACDPDYFKTNFTIVNYVNDFKDADVHILVTMQQTGSGGTIYGIMFTGCGKFKPAADTLTLTTNRDDTADEERSALLGKIQLGLVRYLLKTPFGEKLSLYIDESPLAEDDHDPWKNWVFEVSGSGSFFSQKTSQNLSFIGGLNLDKVTSEIKIRSHNLFTYYESKLQLFDEDVLVYSLNMTQKDWYSRNLMVKSLGDHFGVGGYASFRKSDYSNHDLQVIIGPAIEYNVFPYQDATSRQFTFSYLINYEHAEYEQLTIYNKKREDLFRHDLSVNFFTMQTWGGISLSANASGYINKPSQYSVGANADARISLSDLFRGLSFNISGGFAYCNDQRSLSQQAFSAEDLLTGAREMENDFSYGISIGLSYSFGSRKSNAVNPRFGY